MHNKLALRVTFPLIFLLLSSNFAFAFGIEKYVCPTISAKDKGNDNGKGILTLLMIPGKEMSFFERVIVFGNLVSVSQEKMTAIRVNMFSLLIDGRPNQFIDFLENVSPGIRADLDENVSNARSLWINGRVSYSGVNSDGMFDFTALPAKANLIVPIDVATKSSDVLEFLATFKFESFTGIRASNLIPVVSQVTVKCKKVEGYSQQEHSAWASTVDDIEDVEIEILPGHAMIPALTEQGDLI
ncbi:MAG TPA: hypothetical protein DCL41_02740, partial [Bdellovibrionales bacterium]|nr:hypothetical protein [Bdellovibrionales bacterium]